VEGSCDNSSQLSAALYLEVFEEEILTTKLLKTFMNKIREKIFFKYIQEKFFVNFL
jgi:hypothetical protein